MCDKFEQFELVKGVERRERAFRFPVSSSLSLFRFRYPLALSRLPLWRVSFYLGSLSLPFRLPPLPSSSPTSRASFSLFLPISVCACSATRSLFLSLSLPLCRRRGELHRRPFSSGGFLCNPRTALKTFYILSRILLFYNFTIGNII